jgi:hypothetical protein
MANKKTGPSIVDHGQSATTPALASRNTTIQPHPFAAAFPMMHGTEYAEFACDIKTNGLHEPICLLSGMILDGRHRYRACKENGIEPTFIDYKGSDPLAGC